MILSCKHFELQLYKTSYKTIHYNRERERERKKVREREGEKESERKTDKILIGRKTAHFRRRHLYISKEDLK